ncbi:MAG TPA: PQQ-dependent sugar dehydrogenase [Vicinamibacterales bacterium]|nr:PQQ-dependent sugar dehydrogenase [Vicinamibacterales bacterium]
MPMLLRGSIVSCAVGAALAAVVAVPTAEQAPQPAASAAPACQAAVGGARGGRAGQGQAQGRGAQGAAGGAAGQAAAGAPGGAAGAAGAGRGGGRNPMTPLVPPVNWSAPTLPEGVIMAESAVPAHRNLKLVVTKGLTHPWGMAFLPDGAILITERPGCLRIVRNGVLDPRLLPGVPAVAAQGLQGLMDIALHPRFAENKFVYLTYHKPVAAPAGGAAPAGAPAGGRGRGAAPTSVATLARATWNGSGLTDFKELFSSDVTTEASRIVFGRDGMIYMSLGRSTEGANAPSQDPGNYGGKLLRLRDDGTVPPDNPFVGRTGYKPEIYSMGHRNQLGLAVNPETGEVWASEQGPNGGDEINVIQAGKNYGWPVISYGRSYSGPKVSNNPWQEGMEQPWVVWVPSIALSGMTFYTGDKFPGWKRNVFVGGLRQGESPRTGQINRIEFNDKWDEIRREPMLRELGQRIRDVREGPDGYLYVLTEENDAALIRIEPAN